MEHSYHGDTIGAMSVGARGVFNRPYAPLLFDVTAIPFPAAGAEQATFDARLGELDALNEYQRALANYRAAVADDGQETTARR